MGLAECLPCLEAVERAVVCNLYSYCLSIGFRSSYYKLHFRIGLPSELSINQAPKALPKQLSRERRDSLSGICLDAGWHSKSQNEKISEALC